MLVLCTEKSTASLIAYLQSRVFVGNREPAYVDNSRLRSEVNVYGSLSRYTANDQYFEAHPKV